MTAFPCLKTLIHVAPLYMTQQTTRQSKLSGDRVITPLDLTQRITPPEPISVVASVSKTVLFGGGVDVFPLM